MPSIIVPARYESSRFPGKPLAIINGKEMILHTLDGCAKAVGKDNVYVATDDKRIEKVVTGNGYKCIMTDGYFATGCDRVAYAAQFIDDDIIINVQGDEPLVSPEDIAKAIREKRNYHDHVINCYVFDNDMDEKGNKNTPKCIVKENYTGELMYATRQPCPTGAKIFKRQACIYAFYRNQLLSIYGKDKQKTTLEACEDIEILRCIESNQRVMMIKLKNKYQSVDVPEDVEKVERILNERD